MNIAFPHPPSKEGGPGTFQTLLISKLEEQGHSICYPYSSATKPDAIIVIAGTRKIFWLMFNKFRGVRILHRLDGVLWRYKIEEVKLTKYIRSVLINFLMNFIRILLADYVVYQSLFIKEWWENKYGFARVQSSIIHNAASILFHQNGLRNNQIDNSKKFSIIIVEGAINSDKVSLGILKALSALPLSLIDEIHLYGSSNMNLTAHNINYHGVIPRDKMHSIYSNHTIFVPLEINPPCPNSVIEAISSGCPVVGFDTGSLKELVGNAGVVVDYDANPWELEEPNYDLLVSAVIKVTRDYETYRRNALIEAEKFKPEIMYSQYIEAVKNLISLK